MQAALGSLLTRPSEHQKNCNRDCYREQQIVGEVRPRHIEGIPREPGEAV